MADTELVAFIEELTARTYESQRWPSRENPSGVHVCDLRTDIHIGGGAASVYIRGESCRTLACGYGKTFREAMEHARSQYIKSNHPEEAS